MWSTKKSTNLENEKVTEFNYWGLCSGLKWYMHNVHGTANFKNKVIVHIFFLRKFSY